MIYLDTLNLSTDKTALEIHFKDIFINKIMPYFFNEDANIVFIEVGTLHGKDTIDFKSKYKNSICHCIEGLKANFDKYLSNFKKEYNIYSHNICIASYDGKIIFYEKNGLESGIHGIYNRGSQYGTKKHEYNCIKFSTFCNNNNINNIDVMKIDIEGATYDILFDMSNNNMLKDIKLLHIETESFPFFKGQKLDKECSKILENNNFECIMKSGYHPTMDGEQFDSVWINKSYLKI
jgi:FkbM family methyltransferase